MLWWSSQEDLHKTTHHDVMKMFALLISNRATDQDRLKIIKRAYVVLFGVNNVLLRRPSASLKAKVKTFAYWPYFEEYDRLTPGGIVKFGSYRAGCMDPPPNDADNREWQFWLMFITANGEPLPHLVNMTVISLDNNGCVIEREMREHIGRKPSQTNNRACWPTEVVSRGSTKRACKF